MLDWRTDIRKRDTRREIATCEVCGRPIKAENEDYGGDDYYLINGSHICDETDCLKRFMERYKVRG